MPRKARTCSVENCGGAHVARGYCMRHYQQLRWHGKLTIQKKAPVSGRQLSDNDQMKWMDIPRTETINRTRYTMLSICCRLIVREGKTHGFGRKYCTRCEQPCYWRWVAKS